MGFMCGGFLRGWLCGGGLFGFFGEFLFDIDGVAGDVFAALAEEEPDEHEDGTTEGEETILNGVGPVGSEENDGIDDAETDGIEVATGEDDFLGEGEIASGEGILGAVVGMAEELAVEDELEDATN